jgi:shikimate kinase
MGAGKTSLAKQLAHKLSLRHLDSDAEIEKQEGKPINEIFQNQGESYFRSLEKKWLDNLDSTPTIVSCGGGLPCYNDNIITLKKKGWILYLNTPIHFIIQRLDQDQKRPLLHEKSKEEIIALKQRRELYYGMAHIQISSKDEMMEIYPIIEKQLH